MKNIIVSNERVTKNSTAINSSMSVLFNLLFYFQPLFKNSSDSLCIFFGLSSFA